MDAPTRHAPPRMADERLLLKVPAAARRLDISRSYAYQLARTGELPGVVRLGSRAIRVSVRGLEEWIELHRQDGRPSLGPDANRGGATADARSGRGGPVNEERR